MNYPILLLSLTCFILLGCHSENHKEDVVAHQVAEEGAILDTAHLDHIMDAWHKAAAESDLEAYFAPCAKDFVFLGTDPSERWLKDEFLEFSRPHFEAGRGWDFKPLERNWMCDSLARTAWFDEHLDTHFGICRGSGVLERMDRKWKLKHYNLTLTIYNEAIDSVIAVNRKLETAVGSDQ